ncbi:hypothetical protein L4Z64_001285 [Pseudomonas aeruginosa]|nr:hypothetical protein [Pseudomonas aeruginosa]MCS8414915.1 hypothetical protein [Pseudomonas aeruginosa]MCS9764422.1 hypothetical protein [Pseudomonas aeruginosa]MCS9822462.1 hypothetical protein [Pseudomonas aeruginosa]MCT0241179.1 hypothetical protein [Pseudomonas aeruginosa]
MGIRKIESLENRFERYRRERTEYLRSDLPMIVGIAFVVCFALMYGVQYLTVLRTGKDYEDWQTVAGILALILSIPPIYFTLPKRPTERDILDDQELRRLHGLDDTVE